MNIREYIQKLDRPWPSGSFDWSIIHYTKRLQVRFPVRVHTYVWVRSLVGARTGGN